MIKILFLAVFPLLLVSCASIQPQQFSGPHGKPAYSMECSGFGRTIAACYKKAGEICHKGYTIVDHSSNLNGSGGLISTNESLVIECK